MQLSQLRSAMSRLPVLLVLTAGVMLGVASGQAEPPKAKDAETEVVVKDDFGTAKKSAAISPDWSESKGGVVTKDGKCWLNYSFSAADFKEKGNTDLTAAQVTYYFKSPQSRVVLGWTEFFDKDYQFSEDGGGQKIARFFNQQGGGYEATLEVQPKNNSLTMIVMLLREDGQRTELFKRAGPPGMELNKNLVFEWDFKLPDSATATGYSTLKLNGKPHISIELPGKPDGKPVELKKGLIDGTWVGGPWSGSGKLPPPGKVCTRYITDVTVSKAKEK